MGFSRRCGLIHTPSRARRRTPRNQLHNRANDLRPTPPARPWTHRTRPTHQHLHRHPRRHPRRRLLHQSSQPTLATSHRRQRRTTRTTRTPTRAFHHRPHHRRFTPTTHDYPEPRKTCRKAQTSNPTAELGTVSSIKRRNLRKVAKNPTVSHQPFV